MTPRFRRRRGRTGALALAAAGATAAIAVAAGTPAAAQTTRVVVDASAGVGYASNPFLIVGDDRGSGFTELAVSPQLQYIDELGDAALIARYQRNDYFQRYGGVDAYGVEARATRRLLPTLTVGSSLSYDSSILGQNAFGLTGPIDTVVPPPIGTPDITLIGLRQRQHSVAATLNANWQVSSLDRVMIAGNATRVSYGDTGVLLNSRAYGGTLGYSRSLSARTSVGVQGVANWISFDRTGYSGAIYQPQLTLDHQLSETIHISAAAGLLLIRSETAAGTQRATGLSGSFYGCHTGQRDILCVRAFSDGQATGLGDVSRRLGGTVEYSYRVSENDTVRGAVSYTRLRETSPRIQVPSASFFSVTGGYERAFSRQLFGGIEGGYRRADIGFGTPHDLNVKLFVRARWGDRS